MNYGNPFIKVEWEDTPENLTQERIKRVKEYFKQKYNAADVKIVTKVTSNDSNIKLKSLEANDNILDPQYQKNLVKDFIKENNINIEWDLINRLDNRINSEIDKSAQNKVRYNKWYIRKIEFSNFLSFGDNNLIDFGDLDGITVVESDPKNFGGKSTATVDLLMFLFFNSTSKTKTAIEIFNKFRNCDELKVKGYVTIDGEDYIIERKITRKKTKSGDYNVKTDLEFSKVSADGTIINLAGDQRRETETFITSAIGTEEDFLSTILTTGHNLEEMVDSKPTARGQTLTRFLGLESLKVKEEKCKEIYNEWSKKLVSNTYNKVQLESDNEINKKSIEESETAIVKLTKDLENFEKTLTELSNNRDKLMQSKNSDIDQELIRTNPTLLKREIDDLVKKQKASKDLGIAVIVKEPSQYYSEDDHNKIMSQINEILVNDGLNDGEISRNEKIIIDLKTGSICPTCKRPLEGIDHTKEIDETKDHILMLTNKHQVNSDKLISLRASELVFTTLKKEYEEYERNKLRKAKYELEVEQIQLDIDKNQLRLNNYDNNKKKLEENQKIDGDIVILKTKIDTANADIRTTNVNVEKHKNNIINLKEKIKISLDLIKKIKQEEELITTFKTYLMIFGKNGISKVIMKNMIPLLNQELHRLLIDSCFFTLELNINDKNELEFLMIDNETRVVKSLNSGSGYEKTIASLAIRSILTKVSSLPKPNIVVMDEIFKGIADENLELIGEFFKKTKNYFEHIFVISHNPLVRNWSDNLIMIKKDDNVSSIEYVTTKIS
jgi:DNA repair exonuclease SbcCD ATPase subunit